MILCYVMTVCLSSRVTVCLTVTIGIYMMLVGDCPYLCTSYTEIFEYISDLCNWDIIVKQARTNV